MRQLLRTIIFAILIVGVITQTELSVSTNKTNNEHNTISLNKKRTVAEIDEGLVGTITQIKPSTNKTNDEHISLDIKPQIIKEVLPSLTHKKGIWWFQLIYTGILGIALAVIAVVIYCYCHPYCREHCQRWISRFSRPTRPAEMPVREPEVELDQMPQRQEEVHNLPPNEIETDL